MQLPSVLRKLVDDVGAAELHARSLHTANPRSDRGGHRQLTSTLGVTPGAGPAAHQRRNATGAPDTEPFMTTPRDLLISAMDMAASRTLERGDLSLALAGAEVIDLLTAQAVRLDGDQIVPSHPPAMADRLLDEAASSLVRQAPYESLEDWLWRRGRGLSTAYLDALEADGQLTRQRRPRWMPSRAGQMVLVDSPARREAADRWTSNEPVLAALAAAVGIRDKPTGDSPSVADDAVTTVLAAVDDALRDLEFQRQRRALDEAAFDNIWRGE